MQIINADKQFISSIILMVTKVVDANGIPYANQEFRSGNYLITTNSDGTVIAYRPIYKNIIKLFGY
jgi:hypothetical protein